MSLLFLWLLQFGAIWAGFSSGSRIESEIKWPRSETWFVPVQGTGEIIPGETEQARQFCRDHGLGEEVCESVTETLANEAAKSPIGEERIARLTFNQSVVLDMTLRDAHGELLDARLEVMMDDDVVVELNRFCESNSLSLESCKGLLNQTTEAVQSKRSTFLKNLDDRFRMAVESMKRIESNSMEWKDPILVNHHLTTILEHDPGQWRAWFILGTLYSLASGNAFIAAQFQGKDSLTMLHSSRSCYENALRTLPEDDLVQSTRILEMLGTVNFHLGQVSRGKTLFQRSMDVARKVFKETGQAEALDRYSSSLTHLVVLEANNDGLDNIDVLLEEAAGLLYPDEHFRLRFFAASLYPFVLDSKSEGIKAHVRSEKMLAKLLMESKARSFEEQLVPALGFYSVYSASIEGAASERNLQKLLAQLHRSVTPTLNFVNPGITNEQAKKNYEQERRRRIGFLSSYFYDHSIGKLICPVIEGLVETEEFEVFVIHVGRHDLMQERLGACEELWKVTNNSTESESSVHGLQLFFNSSIEKLHEAFDSISGLNLDVLVFGEIGLTHQTFMLAFGRMAPVQLAFWGHPVTQGLEESIDFMITSQKFLDVQQDLPKMSDGSSVPLCTNELHLYNSNSSFAPFSETLICTETLGTNFKRLEEIPLDALEEARMTLKEAFQKSETSVPIVDAHLFYLPHKLMKIHPIMDAALLEILERDPAAVLIFVEGENQVRNGFSVFSNGKNKLQKRLGNHDRIIWLPAMRKEVFLGVGKLTHATLESFGSFGSGVTALELLSVGVPIVAMPSMQLVTPSAFGFYKAISDAGAGNLDQLVCQTTKCFVDTALKVAENNGEFKTSMTAILESSAAQAALFESDDEVITEWTRILKSVQPRPHFKFPSNPPTLNSAILSPIHFHSQNQGKPAFRNWKPHKIQLTYRL